MLFARTLLLGLAAAIGTVPLAAQLRLGIVGTDTSHVTAFTRIFHDSSHPDHVPGVRIVAAYKGGSPDVESSRTRVDKFAEELRTRYNVEIVPDIATLCSKVDGVLLESVDGRVHLKQFREIAKSGKPVFIDKPLAATLEDAREIARVAKQAGVAWFSTSSLRYAEICQRLKGGANNGVITWGPGPFEEHHYLDLAWYAIHPVEMLFTVMGPGCEEVTRTSGKDADEITCRWKDGRVGAVRAIRPYSDYGMVVFRDKEILQSPPKMHADYAPMLRELASFFRTGVPPVPNEETLEIFAFLDAAQKSKEAGGKPVKLR